MTLWDYLSTDEDRDVASEEILNVLRQSDELGVGTQEIADEIGMSRQGTQNRLEELEENERVKSKKIGETWIWGLHPDERQETIQPEIDRLVYLLGELREGTRPTLALGGGIGFVGFSLIYMGLTGLFVSASHPLVENGLLTILGWAITGVGGTMLMLGGAVVVGTRVIERTTAWVVNRRKTSVPAEDSTHYGEPRGQANPQLLLIPIILIVAGVPLISVAPDIYSSFAATPAFSPFQALVFTVLILATIIAAAINAGTSR